MTTFHRLTTPTYFMSGGWPPSGYDYINNTPGGSQAPADGAKVGGNYPGTYFIDFGEDATSTHGNRAHKALAQNCDQLDDWLNSSVAVPAEVDAATSGTPFTYYQLSGEVFVGKSGTPNNQDERNNLILVLNPTTGEVLQDAFGQPIRCSLLHDGGASPSGSNVIGTQASGFYTAPTVTFSTSIPASTSFRIVYGKRSSLSQVATSDIDAFMRNLLRGAEMVQFTGGVPWQDGDTNGPNTVDGQLQYMLTALTEDTDKDNCGFDRIGAGALPATHIPLIGGSGEEQMEDLADKAAGLHVANVFDATNNFEDVVTFDYLDQNGIVLGTDIYMPNLAGTDNPDDRKLRFGTAGEGVCILSFHLGEAGGKVGELGPTWIQFGSAGNNQVYIDETFITWSGYSQTYLQKEKLAGTSGVPGLGMHFVAMPGTDRVGGTNADGGDFFFHYGAPGTGGSDGWHGQLVEQMNSTTRPVDHWKFAREVLDISIADPGKEIYRYTVPLYSVLMVQVMEMGQTENGTMRSQVIWHSFHRHTGAPTEVGSGDLVTQESTGANGNTQITIATNDLVFTVYGGTESENERHVVILDFYLWNHKVVTPYT